MRKVVIAILLFILIGVVVLQTKTIIKLIKYRQKMEYIDLDVYKEL